MKVYASNQFTMPGLTCDHASCNFTSVEEGSISDKLQHLKLHVQTAHPQQHPQQRELAGQGGHHPQAERVRRPVLDFTGQTLEQEDYEHFQYLFSLYKDRLGPDLNSALLLRECLATGISRAIFSSYGDEMKNLTEEQLFRAISTTCVTKQTLQARVSELYKIKQESGQSVQNFLAALKMKARQCSMKVKCSRLNCTEMVDYSTEIIKNHFIMGLSDIELQQDIMAVENLTLETAVNMAVARETAKRSIDILDTDQTSAAVSAYKKEQLKPKLSPKDCRNCGEKRHKSKDECPAAENKCPCGITGHYKRYCFTGGKPKKQKKDKEEDSDNSCNTFNTCFHISVNDDKPILTLNQTDEGELSGLQFCKKSNKWLERGKDEKDTNLHVIIKPEVKYWAEFHSDTSKHPGKLRAVKTIGMADTGASVTCAGPGLLQKLGIKEDNLCPSQTIVRVASGTRLTILGMLPATIQIVGYHDRRSTEIIYVAKEVKGMYISRRSLQELGCLPPTWPHPQEKQETSAAMDLDEDNIAPCGCPARSQTPDPPSSPPFPITDSEECRARLEEWILGYYSSSTFNICPHVKSQGMTGPPVKFAIKQDADLVCHTKPFKVPLHWKKPVKDAMERDLRLGIIEKLPPNSPAVCCHRMVVTS